MSPDGCFHLLVSCLSEIEPSAQQQLISSIIHSKNEYYIQKAFLHFKKSNLPVPPELEQAARESIGLTESWVLFNVRNILND